MSRWGCGYDSPHMQRPPSQHDSSFGLLARVMAVDTKGEHAFPTEPTAHSKSAPNTTSSTQHDVFQNPNTDRMVKKL